MNDFAKRNMKEVTGSSKLSEEQPIHFLTEKANSAIAQARSWSLTSNLLPENSIKLPSSPSRHALKGCVEQNHQNKDHDNELAAMAFFGSSHQIFNDINTLNLGYTRRSMICLPQTLATSKMMYIDPLHSISIKDLMKISNQSRLSLALQRRPTIILQHSLAHHADQGTMSSLRCRASPIDIAQSIPARHSMSRVVMERQREIKNPKDCMLSGFFPVKLHRLLLDLDQGRAGENTAHFVPNGKAFVILDSHRFETEVMKEYFPRMSSFASFQRQLNLYDFRPTRYGSSSKAYYHPSFMREFPLMCIGMKRIKESRNIGNKKG